MFLILFFYEHAMILPHKAPSWILSKSENLASPSLQDGASKWVYILIETIRSYEFCAESRPQYEHMIEFLCAESHPIVPLFCAMLWGVPTSIVPPINNVCAVSPPSPGTSVPLPHSALSLVLSKVDKMASLCLKPVLYMQFLSYLVPSWILS